MADRNETGPTLVPAQPAVLIVGDQRIPIDEQPLGESVDEWQRLGISRPSDSVLTVHLMKYRIINRIAMGLCVFGAGLLIVMLGRLDAQQSAWYLVGGITIEIVILSTTHYAIPGFRSIQFDLQYKEIVFERMIRPGRDDLVERTVPTKSVLAVQLLVVGPHSVSPTNGKGKDQSRDHRKSFGYELNLILRDGAESRVNLLSATDWDRLRRAGDQIGEFLNVPVIDNVRHG